MLACFDRQVAGLRAQEREAERLRSRVTVLEEQLRAAKADSARLAAADSEAQEAVTHAREETDAARREMERRVEEERRRGQDELATLRRQLADSARTARTWEEEVARLRARLREQEEEQVRLQRLSRRRGIRLLAASLHSSVCLVGRS